MSLERSSASEDSPQGTTESVKYGWALQLVQYEVQRLWVVFGVFLLAETVLLGGVGQVLAGGSTELALGGGVLGFLLIMPWWATFEYIRLFYLLRIEQAKEFEPRVARFLTEGDALFRGQRIRNIKIGWLIRAFRPHRAVGFLITLFAIAFLIIIGITGAALIFSSPNP